MLVNMLKNSMGVKTDHALFSRRHSLRTWAPSRLRGAAVGYGRIRLRQHWLRKERKVFLIPSRVEVFFLIGLEG